VNAYGVMPGVVDWGSGVLASCCHGSNCSLARVQWTAALQLQNHWLLPTNCHFHDCKARLVSSLQETCYIRITGFSFRVFIQCVSNTEK